MLSSDFTGISAQATGSALLIEFSDRRFERHCIPFITVEHANRTGESRPQPASSSPVRLIRGSRPHVLRLVPEGPL